MNKVNLAALGERARRTNNNGRRAPMVGLERKTLRDDTRNDNYQNHMREHGFFTIDHNMDDFPSLVEDRIEPEDNKEEKPKATSIEKTKRDMNEATKKSNARQMAKFHCKHHGANHTHDTEDCRYLKYQAEKNGNDKKLYDKEEIHVGKDKKLYDKEEVHVLLKQTAEKAAKEAIKKTNSAWKKRLREKDNHLMDDVITSIGKLDLDESSVNSDSSACKAGQEDSFHFTSEDNKMINNTNNRCYSYPNAKFTLENLDEIFHFQLQQERRRKCNDQYALSSLAPRAKKTRVRGRLTPVLNMKLQVKLGTPKAVMIRALCDSGTSASIMEAKLAKKLRVKKDSTTVWNTAGGPLLTNQKAKTRFQLPQLSPSMVVESDVHLAHNISNRYDFIMGRDLMRELGIKLDFDRDIIEA